MDPWFYAVHHLEAGTSAQCARGDGGLSTVHANATITTDSALGRPVLRITGISNTFLTVATKAIPPTTRLTFGLRYNPVLLIGPNYRTFLEFRNANGALLNFACHVTTGLAVVRRGTTVLAELGTLNFNAWNYIEGSIEFHNSAGKLALSLEGVPTVDGLMTELNTANVAVGSGCTHMAVCHDTSSAINSSNMMMATDFYMRSWDEDELNFWGPIAPIWRPVEADVSATGWTPDTGDDLSARLQSLETGYIDSTEVGDEARFEIEDIPSNASSIIAVVAITVSEGPEGGAPLVATDLVNGDDVDKGEGRVVGGSAPRTQATAFLTQPSGAAWNPSAVNATELILRSA